MCGIAGVFAYDPRASVVDRAQLRRTCDRMACRGPDGDGMWVSADERVALAHRRLAIIDLSGRGAQPMATAEARCIISFNGEIYNYRALRAQLEAAGRRFVSDSDTEVLLHLWAVKGEAMVHDLRGMFAFAIWDAARRGLFLARDPFGIKPLYYADDGRSLRFASEVKALLAGSGIDTNPEPAGHVGFFLWGSVPEPYTLYRGIRALPAGSTMWVRESPTAIPREYASVARLLAHAESQSQSSDPSAAAERVRDALADTVRHHMVADVDVGVFLSAGLDSTTIAALAAETGGRLKTITLGFAEFRGTEQDEVPLAEEVARHYGTDHQTVWITRRDFDREIDRLLDRMDQPSIDGVNTYFVSQAAANAGLRVALSGLGGDELFGGYPSFRQLPRVVSLTKRIPAVATVGRGVRKATSGWIGALASPKYASTLEYGGDYAGAYMLRRGLFLPWEIDRLLPPEVAHEGLRTLQTRAAVAHAARGLGQQRLKVSALEATWYMRNQLLRDADWASMTHSLEIRVPLVDWTFWQAAAPDLASAPLGKRLLAQAARPALPAFILNRQKTGFSIPVRDWIMRNRGLQSSDRGLRGWARYLHQAQN